MCPLLLLCHCDHWSLVQSIPCLCVLHNVPSFGSLSLHPLVSCTVCSLSVSTTYVPSVGSVPLRPLVSCKACLFSDSISHGTICWISVTASTGVLNCLSTVRQYFIMYRLLVMCHCVHWCFVNLSNVCQYLILHHLLVLCHCVQWRLVQSVHCLSVHPNLPFVGSV